MPYLKNYRLLISHSWHYESQYSTIVTWLNNTSYFKWSNHSVSADRPLNTKTNQQLREELSQQIRGCNAVIVVAGMYTLYSEWINYEIDEALRMKKPIIGIKPCLLFKTKKEGISAEETIYLQFSSKKIYSEIIDLLLTEIKKSEIDYWMYATLSTSYYVIGDNENHKKYEKLFLTHLSANWEKETYFENLDLIKSCLPSE